MKEIIVTPPPIQRWQIHFNSNINDSSFLHLRQKPFSSWKWAKKFSSDHEAAVWGSLMGKFDEGEARHIDHGRVGLVFRKTFGEMDTVMKLHVYYA
jgi:hypothetical protein